MGEVPFFKEIFNIFDKKNGIQKHLLQTLRKIHIIKREVERIYDEAPIVTGTLQLGGKNATVDSSCHLKTCLLYMGAFPEDCEIQVPEWINLWIAEGLILG